MVTARVNCAPGGAADPGVFVGKGRADLGKLPPGKHAVSVSLQPKGAGWSAPPAQEIEVEVAGR